MTGRGRIVRLSLAAAAAWLVGCVADGDHRQRTCEADVDCQPGRACYRGFCVETGQDAGGMDASDDAASMDDGAAPDGAVRDAAADASAADTGTPDADAPDAGAPDAGEGVDSGGVDSGGMDSGEPDAGEDAGTSECADGETQSCYEGPAGTEGVGACLAGERPCTGGAWGACGGQTLPEAESCNEADDDCDGSTDEDFALATDETHCGACGVACPAGWGCCDGTCTDLSATDAHCGACGIACIAPIRRCCSGVCGSPSCM